MRIKEQMPEHIRMALTCALVTEITRCRHYRDSAAKDNAPASELFWSNELKIAEDALLWMRRNLHIVSLSL